MLNAITTCHSEERSDEESAVAGSTTVPLSTHASARPMAQILKRPEVTIEQLAPILRELDPGFFERERDPTTVRAKPSAKSFLRNAQRTQVRRNRDQVRRLSAATAKSHRATEKGRSSAPSPNGSTTASISGLSREMQEKLNHVRPRTLAQASRIPGVTPAAVSLVNVYIEIQARRREQATAV